MNRAAFVKGLVACLAVLLALGVVIARLDRGHHRPEGTAERWLTAVSDSGRAGIRRDATKRADKIGPLSIATPLQPSKHNNRKPLFSDLEVGKATLTGAEARVPFRLHQYASSGTGPERVGVVVMRRASDEWKVVALADRRPAEKVPSEGGPPPSSAPSSIWLLGVVIGLAVTALASFLVEWASGFSRPRAYARA